MVTRERTERIPGHLCVIVTVVVDKTGRNDLALCVDGAARRASQFTHLNDFTVLDGDVTTVGRIAGPIDDAAIFNE